MIEITKDNVLEALEDWGGTELAIQDWENIKKVISDLEPSKAIISKVLTKYLNCVFADIDWQYENLTAAEKAIMSKEEFELLKEAYELK